MQSLRAFLCGRHRLALFGLVLVLCVKALVPAGYMVAPSADLLLSVKLCNPSAESPQTSEIAIPMLPGHPQDDGAGDTDGTVCAFSALSQFATGPVPPVLLAIAIAAIMVLGLRPSSGLHLAAASFLRPPLRAPPARI